MRRLMRKCKTWWIAGIMAGKVSKRPDGHGESNNKRLKPSPR